jgi:predicted transcriptional regulator
MKYEYQERLNKLQSEKTQLEFRINKIKEYEHIYNYFKLIGSRTKMIYIVEIRRLLAVDLSDEGLIPQDIAAILNVDHATLNWLIKRKKIDIEITSQVIHNYEQWIKDKVYPITSRSTKMVLVKEFWDNKEYKKQHILSFKLMTWKDWENGKKEKDRSSVYANREKNLKFNA